MIVKNETTEILRIVGAPDGELNPNSELKVPKKKQFYIFSNRGSVIIRGKDVKSLGNLEHMKRKDKVEIYHRKG